MIEKETAAGQWFCASRLAEAGRCRTHPSAAAPTILGTANTNHPATPKSRTISTGRNIPMHHVHEQATNAPHPTASRRERTGGLTAEAADVMGQKIRKGSSRTAQGICVRQVQGERTAAPDLSHRFSFCFPLVMGLGGDMKGCDALAHPLVAFAGTKALLENIQVKRDVKFIAACDEFGDMLARFHAVDRRSQTRPHEFIIEFLADHGVITPHDAEHIHSPGDFTVSEQGAPCHGAIPVAIKTSKGKIGGKGLGINLLHFDPAEKRQRKPEQ